MKYIDSEKLIAEIERLKEPNQPYLSDFENGCIEGHNNVLDDILSIITSLQQEQHPKSFCEENCKGYRDTGGKCFFGFNCSMKKEQEQPGVKLEEEIHTQAIKLHTAPCYEELKDFAIHFYELGRINARKEE